MSSGIPASQAATGIGLAVPPGQRVSCGVDAVAGSDGFVAARPHPSVRPGSLAGDEVFLLPGRTVAGKGGLPSDTSIPTIEATRCVGGVASAEAFPTGGIFPSLRPIPYVGLGSRTSHTVPPLPAHRPALGSFQDDGEATGVHESAYAGKTGEV